MWVWRLSGLCGGGAAVGERQERPFQLSFNGRLRVDFQGARVTSDRGLLLVRELDERLGLGELIERHLTDGRGKNTQLPLADFVRQSVYSRLAGYGDVNDAERLSHLTRRLFGGRLGKWRRCHAVAGGIRGAPNGAR
jgi:Transposase DDE domain group 1